MLFIKVAQDRAEEVARKGGEAYRTPEGDFVKSGTEGYEYRTGDYDHTDNADHLPDGARQIVPGVDCAE